MNEILTEKAANNLEFMRKQSRLKFSLSDKYLQQDNADLILFQNRYADLNMHYTVRRVMDDYIACMHSKEERLADIADLYKGTGISKDQLSDDDEPCILYGELYTKYKSETIREVISKTNINNTK